MPRMAKFLSILGIIGLLMLFVSCGRDAGSPTAPVSGNPLLSSENNEVPATGLPPATVEVLPLPEPRGSDSGGATLTPSTLEATLRPGECITEQKTLFLPADVQPAKLDLMIMMDLTGSMWEELNNVRVNSTNIATQVRGLIPDSNFGVMSHMDYLGYYSGCGYGAYYGYTGDYPYSLDQPITSDLTAFSAAINALPLGSGEDGPEDYSRPLYESYTDAAVGWRTGAQRIVVQWGDAVPHDCAYDAILGGSTSTGPDPGPDGIAGNADDLAILDVLNGMDASNTILIGLHSGGYLSLWQAYAAITGGNSFQINSDGTVPGGTNIAEYIAGLVGATTMHIDELTLDVCDPAYSDWLVSVTPASYTDITLDVDQYFDFEIQICVPEGTEAGEYCFDVCALGDGAEFARQHVCITVVTTIDVPVDIKPMSCPNPLNPRSKGIVPAAILGTMDLDVMMIDPSSILLAGVAPTKWGYEDVATPFDPWVGRVDCFEDCWIMGPDGWMDLTLKFDIQELVAALGPLENGQCIVVPLTGYLLDGTPIQGEDVMIVRWTKEASAAYLLD